MWRTNLAVALIVLGTLALYTWVANAIPQVESDVPEELVMSADASPEEMAAAGEELFLGGGGCTACHGLGTRAPDIIGVAGSVCADRQPGVDCKQYLHESLVLPSAYVVEGFQPIMPDMSRTLSVAQIWALVAYLQSQGGVVTVTGADMADPGSAGGAGAAAGDATGAGAATAGASAAISAGATPEDMIQSLGCTACHSLGGVGGALGPSFDDMGSLSTDYVRRGILDPAADTAPGFENFAGTMPPNFGDQLTAAQLEALVQYLSQQEATGQ
ncbi:MAG: c-type cytochrome [Gemmatimonadota bacterium]